MKRIPPSARTRESIRELLNRGSAESEDPQSELIRLATRLILEEALEGKVLDLLGREYYQRGAGPSAGHRNGCRERALKTAEGEVRYTVPQVRGIEGRELKELRKHLQGRSGELERLAVEMYARGCSVRDIEAIFRDGDGKLLLSRTAVSEITEVLWAEYEEFATRDLSEIQPLYLFLDGLAERLRPGVKREAILCAWCITWEGKKVLIHVAPGTKESTECCRDFLEDLKRRGLSEPVTSTTDGAPGLIRGVEECFPIALRQRCLAHRMRNLDAKLPAEIRVEFKQAARAAYQAPSLAMARALREDLVERYASRCPTAVRCFEEDFEACIAHLHCPPAHQRMIRTSNLLERLFGEERRRMKVVPTMFGERPVLKLMYASLIRGTESWRGIGISEFEHRQLQKLREELIKRHRDENQPAVRPGSTPEHIYSKDRT
jgi:transposase-like protein